MKNKLGLIQLLTSSGYRVLEVDEKFFIVSEYVTPDDTEGGYHLVVGKEVTKIFENYSDIASNDVKALLRLQENLNGLPIMEIQFMGNFKTALYVSTKMPQR